MNIKRFLRRRVVAGQEIIEARLDIPFLLSELLTYAIASVTLARRTSACRRQQFFTEWQIVMAFDVRQCAGLIKDHTRRSQLIFHDRLELRPARS
jgi:hypothetical protein